MPTAYREPAAVAHRAAWTVSVAAIGGEGRIPTHNHA